MNNKSECSPGYPNTRKQYMKEHEARVFSYIVFECLDIPVRYELELFIWLLKLIET